MSLGPRSNYGWHALSCGPMDLSPRCIRAFATPASSSEDSSLSLPPSHREWLPWIAPILIVLTLMTFLANVLVLFVFYKKPKIRIHSNLFMVALAMADISVATLVMPLSIYKYINHYAWWLGPHLCRFWIFSDCYFCTVSVNCLVSVAFDRFQAVLYPMKYARTTKTTLQVSHNLIVTWMVSLCLIFPLVLTFLIDPKSINYRECSITFNGRMGFLFYTFAVSFALPLMALIAIYWTIYVKTSSSSSSSSSLISFISPSTKRRRNKKRKKNTVKPITPVLDQDQAPAPAQAQDHTKGRFEGSSPPTQSPLGSSTSPISSEIVIPGEGSSPLDNRPDSPDIQIDAKKNEPVQSSTEVRPLKNKSFEVHLAREHRLVRIIFIVVLGYVVCWLPFWICYLMIPLCHLDFCQSIHHQGGLVLFCQWLGYFNSLANPIIYNAFNRDFKSALNEIVVAINNRNP
ncbi:probable G-protein coupled receptor No18 isoform X2 [Tigriopus californicus]|nr:probable G-protein coupled receptor No18 isoform X2 [Tigriopus californicus]